MTDPVRTASEQFLLSEAARLAVEQLATTALRDRKAWVDASHFAPSEKEFVIAEFRAHLVQEGVRLVDAREDADVVIELRSGGVGIDRNEFLLGIPPVLLSPDLASSGAEIPVILPEIAIVKSIKQRGVAGVAYVAYWQDTGELISASGPHYGYTRREDYWLLGYGPRSTGNIPSLKSGDN